MFAIASAGLFAGTAAALADTTPPVINLYPLPPVTDQSAVDVRGTVSDVSPCNVTVNGIWALVETTGLIAVRVPLVPGNNSIEVRAVDRAGNVAVAVAYVEFVPPDRWFVHPEKHFRIPIPYGWHGVANFTQNGVPVDVYMYTASLDANLIVVSESRHLAGTSAEARGILAEATSNISRWAGFRFLVPPFDQTLDGHVAAAAFVTWQPPGETVDQIITIVLGPEYEMFWAVIGTMTPGNATQAAPLVNRTVAGFEVLPPPSFDITQWRPEILGAALVATTVEGIVLALKIVRVRRGRMPWDRAYL